MKMFVFNVNFLDIFKDNHNLEEKKTFFYNVAFIRSLIEGDNNKIKIL